MAYRCSYDSDMCAPVGGNGIGGGRMRGSRAQIIRHVLGIGSADCSDCSGVDNEGGI